jgi:F0F1-type ATP synthase assembly protein I
MVTKAEKAKQQKVAISKSSIRALASALLGAISGWLLDHGNELGAVGALLAAFIPVAQRYFDTNDKAFGRTE